MTALWICLAILGGFIVGVVAMFLLLRWVVNGAVRLPW
jgi:hypothetical protein